MAQSAHEAVEDAGRTSEGAQKVPGWVGGDNLRSGSYNSVVFSLDLKTQLNGPYDGG